MQKKLLLTLAFLVSAIFPTTSLVAQDSGTKASAPSESASTEKSGAQKEFSLETYRLDLSINEMENGKKINTRQYSTNLSTRNNSDLRIGTKVPVETKAGEFEYLDIGTNIFARLGESHGQTELTVSVEISSFAQPDAQDQHDMHPMIRQMKMGGSTQLPLNKPIVLASADDPNSKREFQLEVTATKER